MQSMNTEHSVRRAITCFALIALTACQGGADPSEIISFAGTEPFWGGRLEGGTLTYTTPENIDGTAIAIERFAGNHGLGLSGKLGEEAFDMTVTPGECSDGMSDRVYPLTVTLSIDGDVREGCGWTDRQPFSGPQNP